MKYKSDPLFYRGFSTLFSFFPCKFGKNANSASGAEMDYFVLLKLCLATIGACIFRCGNSGCRTFIFSKEVCFIRMKYESPIVEFITIKNSDVISTSPYTDPDIDFEDDNVDMDGWL